MTDTDLYIFGALGLLVFAITAMKLASEDRRMRKVIDNMDRSRKEKSDGR